MNPRQPGSPSGGFAQATFAGASVVVAATLPGFLTGALSVQLSSDLHFNPTMLGLTIALWRLSSAISAAWLGNITDRVGGRWALRLATVLATISCLGIALSASSWPILTAWLVVAGLAHALAVPGSNRMLANLVPSERQGLAFGFRSAAPPLASVIAGLSIPLIVINHGWQIVFALAGALSALNILLIGRRGIGSGSSNRPTTSGPTTDRRTLWTLRLAIGLATTASSSVPVFFVSAGVAAGMDVSIAGTALAAASLSAIAVRVVLGGFADRRESGHLRICSNALLIGAVGLVLLSTGGPILMAIGGVVALGGAWGFPGVFWLTIVRAFPDAPGRTTGALTPGALIGSTVGPLAAGALADHLGFVATWSFAALAATAATLAMRQASLRLASLKDEPPTSLDD